MKVRLDIWLCSEHFDIFSSVFSSTCFLSSFKTVFNGPLGSVLGTMGHTMMSKI